MGGTKDCQDISLSTTAQGTSAAHSVHSTKEKKASVRKPKVQDSKKEPLVSPEDDSLSDNSADNSGDVIAPKTSKVQKKAEDASRKSSQQVPRKSKAE